MAAVPVLVWARERVFSLEKVLPGRRESVLFWTTRFARTRLPVVMGPLLAVNDPPSRMELRATSLEEPRLLMMRVLVGSTWMESATAR